MNTLSTFFKTLKVVALPSQLFRLKKGLFLTVFQALADVIGLAAIVPVLMLAIDGDFLEKSSKLRWLYSFSPFTTESSFLIGLIVLVLLFFIGKNLFAYWVQHYIKKVSSSIVAQATQIKYTHFINKEYQEIIDKGTPDFVNNVMNIPYHFVTGMLLPFVTLFSELAIVLFFSTFILYNPLVFLILIFTLGPAVYLINKSIKAKVLQIGEVSGKLREDALNELNLGINGITEIKLHQISGFFISRFVKKQFQYARNELKSLQMQSVPSRVLELIALVGVAFLVIYGYLFSDNPSEIRVLGALFVICIFRLIPAINRSLVSLMHLKMFSYTADELQKAASYYQNSSENIFFNNKISFNNISYAFPNADFNLLENISFEIKKSELVGLAGESGTGKSTLVKVLLRLLKEKKGEILVDGTPLTQENELCWQSLIGYVGQQPYILKGSVLENIAMAEIGEIDKNKIISSLKLAGLDQFATEEGIYYNVGENGVFLSEGQKQRLALARVIYKGNTFIVLDETTSALDEATEKKVVDTLKALANKGFTILIVAHKKTILQECHKVYEICNRKIKLYT